MGNGTFVDRLARAQNPTGLTSKPTWAGGDELRLLYGHVVAVGHFLTDRVIAVKIKQTGARGTTLVGGNIAYRNQEGKLAQHHGAWIPWKDSYEEALMHPPRDGDAVRVIYTGGSPTSGYAERVGKLGTFNPEHLDIPERGFAIALSAKSGGGF